MKAKRIERRETVFQWKALVMCELMDASERQAEYAETFLRVPPSRLALVAVRKAA